jgi:hypothetical protein
MPNCFETVIHSQRIYGTRVSIVGTVSPKSDVLSYGILVLEIITGRKNGSYGESNKVVNLLTDVSRTFILTEMLLSEGTWSWNQSI